jgi:hypothetical protein
LLLPDRVSLLFSADVFLALEPAGPAEGADVRILWARRGDDAARIDALEGIVTPRLTIPNDDYGLFLVRPATWATIGDLKVPDASTSPDCETDNTTRPWPCLLRYGGTLWLLVGQ